MEDLSTMLKMTIDVKLRWVDEILFYCLDTESSFHKTHLIKGLLQKKRIA